MESSSSESVAVNEFVRLEVEDGVATIRLDRPPMNALSLLVQAGIKAAAAEAGERKDVRAVVVYGGPKVFAAGADVKEMVGWDYQEAVARSAGIQAAFTAVARIPKPTIAAVTGYALGGGCELALCCDLRIAGDNAKLGQPEILLGIIPGAGGTQRLTRLVGPSRSKDIIFSGRFVDAEESLRIGLVDKVVAPDDVYTEAVALARRLAAGPPYALRAAKEAIDRGLEVDLDTGLELERLQFTALFATEDRATGMSSFVEHGPGKAEFTGALSADVIATPDQVRAAFDDPKLANVLYHDWEASTYDDKWSISYDQRCIDYARDRFSHVAGIDGWPYGKALELGCGTGFFLLNLKQAGVLDEGHVTDISPGMVSAAQRNAESLGFRVEGRVADAESLPYDDATFDLVVGHAVLHHIPDVDLAMREVLRVLKPGGRFVFAGEPTKRGDWVARRLSRATWWAATRATRVGPLRERYGRPESELAESSAAAALEAVVDIHTFDPSALARLCLRAGAVDVRTVTEELTASWFGWPVRTVEAAVRPGSLGWTWAMFAYKGWLRLSALDEKVLSKVVPDELFYNVCVTGTKP